jgi:hypothetical protein
LGWCLFPINSPSTLAGGHGKCLQNVKSSLSASFVFHFRNKQPLRVSCSPQGKIHLENFPLYPIPDGLGKENGVFMKVSKIFRGALLGLAMLLASHAFAANKGSLYLIAAANVAGKQLPAGEYDVRWEGTGPTVEVKIMKGSKVIVTVPATVVTLDEVPIQNAAVVITGGDGSRNIEEIRFSGKKFALQTASEPGEVNAKNRN